MSEPIYLDEWMAEMARLQRRDAEGLSVEELAEGMAVSERLVRKRLRPLVRGGRVEVGQRRSTRIDGVACLTPVYRLKGGGDV